jgi:hypothetical protein
MDFWGPGIYLIDILLSKENLELNESLQRSIYSNKHLSLIQNN